MQRPSAINLDTLTAEDVQSWKQGDRLLLNGKMLTGPRCRAQAHSRICWPRAKSLPVDFKGRVIYYVGPVDPVREEVVGPAGPTTATRMDKFFGHDAEPRPARLGGQGGARRGGHRFDCEAQVGLSHGRGRSGLSRQPARSSNRRSWALPISAWKRSTSFTVEDMPVTVAVDSTGRTSTSLPRWCGRRRSQTRVCCLLERHARQSTNVLLASTVRLARGRLSGLEPARWPPMLTC